MNMASFVFLILSACVCNFFFVHASDPDPLQDFCVADYQSNVFVNGLACKDPRKVKSADFVYRGLRKPGNTNNSVSGIVTTAFVDVFPGLNTQGISIVRIDIAPGGQNRPHHHPRASEVLVVIQGRLLVGFITTNPNNTLYSTTLEVGDVFVFPRGLVHFQQNVGKGPALAFAALNSQTPGVLTEANAIFGANPSMPGYILARAFMLAEKVVDELQARFLALGGNP